MNTKKMTHAQLMKMSNLANTELRARENKAKDIENKKILGKCYKFDNCYSSDQHWTGYVKAHKIENGGLRALCFQIDCYGKAEVEIDRYFHHLSGYIEIPQHEFDAAASSFKNYVEAEVNKTKA